MPAALRLLIIICAITAVFPLYATTVLPEPAPQTSSSEQPDDCFRLGNTTERESCFAKVSEDQIDACEHIKPSACRPYKDMYTADRQIQTLNAQLLTLAKKAYGSYARDDSTYLSDLYRYARASNRAWQTYRDTQCALEPFMQGMSRQESADLTEACRFTMTKARIGQLNEQISALK